MVIVIGLFEIVQVFSGPYRDGPVLPEKKETNHQKQNQDGDDRPNL